MKDKNPGYPNYRQFYRVTGNSTLIIQSTASTRKTSATPYLNFFKKTLTTLLKKGLQHSYFPVKFSKFSTAPFFTKRLRWLVHFAVNVFVQRRCGITLTVLFCEKIIGFK